MAWWSGFMRGKRMPEETVPTTSRVFSASVASISDYLDMLASRSGPCTRDEALSVPGLLKGRNQVCGALAALALEVIDKNNNVVPNSFLAQPDPDVGTIVHMAQTIEDLLFYGVSWWVITAYSWDGFPAKCRRVDPLCVSVNPPVGQGLSPLPSGLDPRNGSVVWVDGLPVDGANIIRFDSPLPGILAAGATTIRKAILLARAAKRYAESPQPTGYLRAQQGASDPPREDIPDLLAEWEADRRRGATGYVPRSLEYVPLSGPSAVDIQLIELIKESDREIAQLVGLDSEELSVSTTSRTYANVNDARTDRINETYAPFVRAIEDRLSIPGNVVPRGQRVRFRLADFLRSNASERWGNYATAVAMGAMTVDEVRAAEGLPPLTAADRPALPPAPAPVPVPEEAMA